MTMFPKPKNPPKPVFKVFRDGREVCSDTKAGRDEYDRRKRVMWERQKRRCCLEGKAPGCPGRLRWEESSFEHEAGRGSGGSKRDDRIEVPLLDENRNPIIDENGTPKMKRQNGAAHHFCNSWKASRKVDYADVP